MNHKTLLQSKKVNEDKISLFTILSCHLCSNKANCAHICPNCSKFYCESCIKDWLKNGHSQCPNCKCYLNEGNIVNCTKLSLDLSSALQALIDLEVPQQIECNAHGIGQVYYCEDCHISICSDCIVLESKHKNHGISKIKKIKTNFNQQVLLLMSKIRKNMKESQKMKEDLHAMKYNRNEDKKGKFEILNKFMEVMKNKNQQTIDSISSKLTSCLDESKLVYLSSQKIYQQFLNEIKGMSQISLVRSKTTQLEQILSSEISKVQKNSKQKQNIGPLSNRNEIANMVHPSFGQKTFVLYNYSQFRQKKQLIYSDSFYHGPLQWRLKIYPNGLSNSSNVGDEYISIYIQLVSGVREGSRYKFNIEILNQNEQNFGISQIYEECFDTGKCWGYDQFANIATLYQKGYVHAEDDSIKISVSVGAPSYYYATLDKQAIITKTHQKISQNAEKIALLKQKISQAKANIQNVNPSTNSQIKILQTLPIQQQTFEDVTTPRCKLPTKNEEKQAQAQNNNQNISEFCLDFQNYVVESNGNGSGNTKINDQLFDYQSGQLRKIFRRFSSMADRGKVLMF